MLRVATGLSRALALGLFILSSPLAALAQVTVSMETKRQLHVLDTHLAAREYLADDYSIADMAAYPWYGALLRGAYNAADFLSVQDYPNVARWAAAIEAREPVQRGRLVNAVSLPEEQRVPERHEAADIDRVRAAMRDAGGT